MNIVLIGFMGSGKSTIAKSLSNLLGISLIEMDELVCRKTQAQTMHEVFLKGGELLLRETEIALAKEYSLKTNQVIATGGGVVLNKIVLDYFKASNGKVIFLNTTFKQIIERLKGDDSRPLIKDLNTTKKLYLSRLSLYLNYADEIIEAGSQSPHELALKIKDLITGKEVSNGF